MNKRRISFIELARLYEVLAESSDRLVLEIDAPPVALHAVIEAVRNPVPKGRGFQYSPTLRAG